MEEVTIILIIAALLAYVLSLKMPTRTVHVFSLVLSVCGLSAIFQDTTIIDEQVYLIAFPLIAVAFFSIAGLCVIKEDK